MNSKPPVLHQLSQERKGFYVPEFRVIISPRKSEKSCANKEKTVLTRISDIQQVTYQDTVKGLDSFSFVVNNVDEKTQRFKYVGGELAESKGEEKNNPEAKKLASLFEPCGQQVEIKMGYTVASAKSGASRNEDASGNTDSLPTMMRGTVTTLALNFSSKGPYTLTVRGINVLHRLRGKQHTDAWPKKAKKNSGDPKDNSELLITFSEILRDLNTKKDKKKKKKRFPLDIVLDPEQKMSTQRNATESQVDQASKKEQIKNNDRSKDPKLPFVIQRNQYDIDFIYTLSRRLGYDVFLDERRREPGSNKCEEILCVQRSEQLKDVTLVLKWGESLIDFKPKLTTANQVTAVTVNGWNRRDKKPIQKRVSIDPKDPNNKLSKKELKKLKNLDLFDLILACEAREEEVVDLPVFTEDQAFHVAIELLKNRTKDLVTADGTTIGIPELRAGRLIQIEGLGPRFNGIYFVTKTTHTISDKGYITTFSARREHTAKKQEKAT